MATPADLGLIAAEAVASISNINTESDEPSPDSQAEERPKFFFTDSQRATLKEYFYNKGMNSTSKQHAATISQIAIDIGATEPQVKVGCIANQLLDLCECVCVCVLCVCVVCVRACVCVCVPPPKGKWGAITN